MITPKHRPGLALGELRAGDCLLYRPSGVFGLLIALKTWNHIAHVEVYAGDGTSLASRDGLGVNRYAFRRAQLAYVLRPAAPINWDAALAWFDSEARGQAYDWIGLLCFALAVKQGSPNKQFCSEFATRLYRAGQARPFSDRTDADRVAPAQFLQTPFFSELPVWWDGKPC